MGRPMPAHYPSSITSPCPSLIIILSYFYLCLPFRLPILAMPFFPKTNHLLSQQINNLPIGFLQLPRIFLQFLTTLFAWWPRLYFLWFWESCLRVVLLWGKLGAFFLGWEIWFVRFSVAETVVLGWFYWRLLCDIEAGLDCVGVFDNLCG